MLTSSISRRRSRLSEVSRTGWGTVRLLVEGARHALSLPPSMLGASGPTGLELRQAYARLLMNEGTVKDKEIRITSSKSALARAALPDLRTTPIGVISFVREWRAREDSNSRPPDS